MKISEIISNWVDLKKQGRWFIGLCPFHKERTPSFTVDDAKGFYSCFGCSAHGDAKEFIGRINGYVTEKSRKRQERIRNILDLKLSLEETYDLLRKIN